MLVTAIGDYSYHLNDNFLPLFNSLNTKEYQILRVIKHGWKLTTKIRYMCNDQQIFRVSDEETEYMEYKDVEPIIAMVENMVDCYDVVLMVDYNKGMMTPALIQAVIKVCLEKKIPVISDIKYKNVVYYDGSLVIKCNDKEYFAMQHRPESKYYVVTHGKLPVSLTDNSKLLDKVKTIGNPYFKNANCAGDIFTAGFVNSFVNNDIVKPMTSLVRQSVKAGNILASKSLSKVKDKVV
jgi:hypothetical protein